MMHPQLAPMAHPTLDIFLLGFITACSLVSAVFFLRFWRAARDPLFLGFAIFFVVQGIRDAAVLGLDRPNEGTFLLYLVRLLSVVGILLAIVWKNVKQ